LDDIANYLSTWTLLLATFHRNQSVPFTAILLLGVVTTHERKVCLCQVVKWQLYRLKKVVHAVS